MTVTHDDEMPEEIDFSRAARGKFFRPKTQLKLPLYLEKEVQDRLAVLADAKGLDLSELGNNLLREDIARMETAE